MDQPQGLVQTIVVLALALMYLTKWLLDNKKESNGGSTKSIMQGMRDELSNHRIREEAILQKLADSTDEHRKLLERVFDRQEQKFDKICEMMEKLRSN